MSAFHRPSAASHVSCGGGSVIRPAMNSQARPQATRRPPASPAPNASPTFIRIPGYGTTCVIAGGRDPAEPTPASRGFPPPPAGMAVAASEAPARVRHCRRGSCAPNDRGRRDPRRPGREEEGMVDVRGRTAWRFVRCSFMCGTGAGGLWRFGFGHGTTPRGISPSTEPDGGAGTGGSSIARGPRLDTSGRPPGFGAEDEFTPDAVPAPIRAARAVPNGASQSSLADDGLSSRSRQSPRRHPKAERGTTDWRTGGLADHRRQGADAPLPVVRHRHGDRAVGTGLLHRDTAAAPSRPDDTARLENPADLPAGQNAQPSRARL